MVRKAWHLLLVIALLAAVASAAPGCASPQEEAPSQETDSISPITTKVSFPDGAPPLNHEAKLSCTVRARNISLKNLTVEIRLPEALELVGGALSWSGDIASGDEVEVISLVVRAIKTGNWTIEFRRSLDPDRQGALSFVPGWYAAIYVSVTEDSAEWGITRPWYKDKDPTKPVEMIQEDE